MEDEDGREQAGRTLNVSIEKMVYGGDGLARTAEGVLLVPLVLPGERVIVQPEERSKGVRRARLLDLVEPSADRVVPECPYFARCGGCQYQHIRYGRQLEAKQKILSESFERIGKLHLEMPVSAIAAEPWHYRNRSRLQLQKNSSRFEIGYFALFSHNLCAIDHCPISSPAINDAIRTLARDAGAACFPSGEAEIELFASDSDEKLLVTVHSAQAPPRAFGDEIRKALPAVESVSWCQKASGGRPVKVTTWGSGALVYRAGEFHYRVGHDSFFQTNRFLVRELIDTATADQEGDRALDLYAGVGLFTVPLARHFKRVAAVEFHPGAARDLESNVGAVSANARAYHLTAEKFVATASGGWDLIVADPPRSGLSRMVVEHVLRLRPRRFVYVSCDPTTLARDVAAMVRAGYGVKAIHLIDLFPQTFHLETVVHLQRPE